MYPKKGGKNQHSGYGALRLKMGHSPKPVTQKKFSFIHWKSSFPRIYLIEIRSACSSLLSAAYSLWWFACHWEFFLFSCWQKKKKLPYYFMSQQASGVSSLVSFCSALENHIIPSATWHFRGWWIISCLDHQNIVLHLTKLDNFSEHQGMPPSAVRRISSLHTQTVRWGNCRAELTFDGCSLKLHFTLMCL